LELRSNLNQLEEQIKNTSKDFEYKLNVNNEVLK